MATWVRHGFLYLASPYSHPDASVREKRYETALHATAFLMREGFRVFSPVVHTHHLEALLTTFRHNDWLYQDFGLLDRAAALVILSIDGTAESKGVQAEFRRAVERAIPVYSLKVDDDRLLQRI